MKLSINIYDEISKMLAEGVRPLIRVNSDMCDEFLPLSEGMITYITGVDREDESYADDSKKDLQSYSLKLYLDWSGFDHHNLPLMAHDYYNSKTEEYDLTALEAGEWPENHKSYTYIFVAKENNDDSFDFLENRVIKYLDEAKAANKSLLDYLMDKIEEKEGDN